MKGQNNCSVEIESQSVPNETVKTPSDKVSYFINNLLDPSTGSFSYKALLNYKSTGDQFYQEACELEKQIHSFETNIRRPYFHVKPLDDSQLENWHCYLDFVQMQNDFDWVVKLYERCLIPCASYPEFWMRYVDYMETKGAREIANSALDRAKNVFLKNTPEIHFFNAQFKEQIGDIDGARAEFLPLDDEFGSYFVQQVVKEANMEKRMGNFTAAACVYEKSLEMAAQRQKLHTVPVLYIHFCHLKYMMTSSTDTARDVIIEGIRNVPHCKILLEGLINFLMAHGGQGQVDVVDNLMADAISAGTDSSQGLSRKDREDISVLYLQLVDQCGTVHDTRKAWNRHMKLFPHLLRTISLDKRPSGNHLLNMLMEVRENNHFPLSDESSGGNNSDQFTQIQMKGQILTLPENSPTHPTPVFKDNIQQEDVDNITQERLHQLSPKVTDHSMEEGSDINKSTPDSIHQVEDDATGQIEVTHLENQFGEVGNGEVGSTHGLEDQSEGGAHGPVESNLALVHESGGDPHGPSDSTHALVHGLGEDTFSCASHECVNSIDVQKAQDSTHERHLEPLSLDGLSINSLENSHGDLMPRSYEHEAPRSNKMPENTQIVNESPSHFQNELVNPLSMESQDNSQPEQMQLKQQVPADGLGNWHHRNKGIRTSIDARSRFRRNSREQRNQRRQISSHAKMGAQMPTSQGYPGHSLSGQNQDQICSSLGNPMATHSWPTQNLKQQNIASPHQSVTSLLPPSHPQAEMPHFTAYNQAYNQMMENYFQQQQQMILQQHYEQQQQFMQQAGQQVQQPYQQQPPHTAHQQCELQAQQHQQLMQLYYQQSPQLQEWQGQQMHQHLLVAQQQGQLYHQFMQLQEQYQHQGNQQLQQQQGSQVPQHNQQHQHGYQVPQHNQQQLQQPQQQQHISSAQIPIWNGSYYQEGQQVMPPNGTSGNAESSHCLLQHQGITPPHDTSISGSSVSSHHQQQPPTGATAPSSVGAPGPVSSPYNQQ
ncbi:hypothetical protein NMG60_11012964 [Bertholletia excelsa]